MQTDGLQRDRTTSEVRGETVSGPLNKSVQSSRPPASVMSASEDHC